MNRPLIFRPEVRDDIDQIYLWYDGLRAGLGERFLAEMQVVLDRVERTPELHPPTYRNVRYALVRRSPMRSISARSRGVSRSSPSITPSAIRRDGGRGRIDFEPFLGE